MEKKDPVFVFPPVIQGRDGIDGNYFPVGVDAEDECVGVGQQNLKHWRQPEAELDGQSLHREWMRLRLYSSDSFSFMDTLRNIVHDRFNLYLE